MLNISYNISPRLKEHLSKIEALKKEILLTPISQSLELRIRWEATFSRTHYSLKLAGNPLKRKDMLKLLSEVTHKKINKDQEAVVRYKAALDHISQNWQGSQNAVDAQTIIDLNKKIDNGTLRVPKAGLQKILDYIQTERENPIIQAAIIIVEMEKTQLFTGHNSLIAHLTADLFLTKYGYNPKGFLAYEAGWMEDEKLFRENHKRALDSVSLTLWIEYFTQNMAKQLEAILRLIERPRMTMTDLKRSFWELNERQRSILSYLDQPHTTITNRQAQKMNKTSQITASRDLAKLMNLGMLLSHGKGRSVYYTRI